VALTAEDKVQRIAALEQQAAEKVAEGGVEKHAERILKTNGMDYAKRLVTALEHVIGAAEAEKVVKEPQSAAVQPIKAKKAKKATKAA
jgi:kynureninase